MSIKYRYAGLHEKSLIIEGAQQKKEFELLCVRRRRRKKMLALKGT